MHAFVERTGRTIVVTLGSEGVIAASPKGEFAVPALKITPVDTVGAGDTFCGYLGAALAAGLLKSAVACHASIAVSGIR